MRGKIAMFVLMLCMTVSMFGMNASAADDCTADNNWISTWSTPLNKQVRYGKMGLDEFLYGYIEKTNKDLLTYKK